MNILILGLQKVLAARIAALPIILTTFIIGSLAISASAQAENLPDFTDLIETQSKAVVRIDAQISTSTPSYQNQEIPELFRYFFENPYESSPRDNPRATPRSRSQHQEGSGFIIDSNGYVVTNAHVVSGANNITVTTANQREYPAKLVGLDKRSDVALLKIDDSNLSAVKLGNSDQIKVGEWVLAIGNPFGFDYTATKGIISAVSRSLPDGTYVPFIQTDAAVNPGNSGGPLFNLAGEVIGVNSQIYSSTGSFNGLAFAIPINVAMNIVKQIKDKGFVSRGWLGVAIQNVDYDLAKSFGLDKPKGALVSMVTPSSPAEKAGFQEGDIILSLNNQEINKSSALPPIVANLTAGEKINAQVLRLGKEMTLSITIGNLEENGTPKASNAAADSRGLQVEPLTPALKQQFNAKSGVIVSAIEPNSVAERSGFQVGDVLLSINGRQVNNIEEFSVLMKKLPSNKPIACLINRAGNKIFIALK